MEGRPCMDGSHAGLGDDVFLRAPAFKSVQLPRVVSGLLHGPQRHVQQIPNFRAAAELAGGDALGRGPVGHHVLRFPLVVERVHRVGRCGQRVRRKVGLGCRFQPSDIAFRGIEGDDLRQQPRARGFGLFRQVRGRWPGDFFPGGDDRNADEERTRQGLVVPGPGGADASDLRPQRGGQKLHHPVSVLAVARPHGENPASGRRPAGGGVRGAPRGGVLLAAEAVQCARDLV
mmetsp:Transcript_91777/g.280848  ORF Transcript_91777/g.280848 Transcript_91777/m.280848 type:complete len:231 (-) Transcript_91777:284-976(-)